MPKIILIETATALCSAAICDGERIISSRRSDEPRAHASKTALFVKEMLDECGLKASDCDAVAVSMGPGSYTGLRVGVSTAKGLGFGAGLPIIGIGTLDTLVWQYLDAFVTPGGTVVTPGGTVVTPGLTGGPLPTALRSPNGVGDDPNGVGDDEGSERQAHIEYIIPVIDARRMEVYTAVYSADGKRLTEVAPVVVDSNSFAEYLAKGRVVFIGDGAEKIAPVVLGEREPSEATCGFGFRSYRTENKSAGAEGREIPEQVGDDGVKVGDDGVKVGDDEGSERQARAEFIQCYPEASAMLRPALEKYEKKQFEDLAYFEPFYLKDFVATVGKKLF